MLYVAFRLGNERYALAADLVVEALPVLQLKALPGMPRGVAGLCNYRGKPLPVLDLAARAIGEPARGVWGTRVLVVRYPDDGPGDRSIGLLVVVCTHGLRLGVVQFIVPGVRNEGAPYQGPVTVTPDGLVQRVDVRALLPEDLRAALFEAAEDASA